MEVRKPMRFFVVLGVFVMSACAGDGEASLYSEDARQYRGEPSCPGDKLAETVHDYARARGPGAGEKPEVVLGRYLAHEYPGLSVRDFTPAADSRDAKDRDKRAVVFAYDDPQAGGIRVVVEASGDSWAVANTQVCYEVHKQEAARR